DLDEPARVEVDPGLDQADPVGGRRHAHGEQAVRAGHLPAVGERDDHAVALAVHGLGAGLAEYVHAAPPEDALDDHGGVLVLVRQDALTGRHQRDLRAERLVGAGELGAGYAGADHDQLFRQLGQVVELAAGQDALAVRHHVGQRPGGRPGRDEHDVGLDRRPARGDRVRPGQPSPGLDDAHALAADMLGDVVGLRGRQGLDPRVERGSVHLDHGVSAARELQAEGGGAAERGHGRRRLDQRLARDTVRKHAGAAKAVLVDDGYVGTQLRGDESGLVAAGAAAADSDIRTRQGHVKQLSRMPASALARGDAPCTPCTRLVNAKAAWYPPFRVYPVRLGSVALYAAYGSNMDPAQMLLRCPHSPQRGTGWLEGWRLSFGGEELGWDGALTTVVEDPAQRVFVALYDVPEIDEKELDSWDGVNLGFYSKIKVRVQTLEGDALAWLYVLDAYEGGLPSAQRLSILVDAALKAGAPDDYVDWVRARPSNPPELYQGGDQQGEARDDNRRDGGPVPGRDRRRRLVRRSLQPGLLGALGERGDDFVRVKAERVAFRGRVGVCPAGEASAKPSEVEAARAAAEDPGTSAAAMLPLA